MTWYFPPYLNSGMEWNIGSKFLYNHPAKMGIKPKKFYDREFVKLVDVVWPLADVHDPVHKMNYERLLPIHG